MSMSFSWHLSLSILGTKDCFEGVGAVITLMNTGDILTKPKIDKVLNFTGLYALLSIMKFPNFRHLKWKKLLPLNLNNCLSEKRENLIMLHHFGTEVRYFLIWIL